MKKESLSLGIFYMMASATSLSFIALFAQLGLRTLSLESVLFWRFFCGFLFSWILLKILKEKTRFNLKLVQRNLLRAIFVLGSQYSFFFYIERNSLLNATALLNTGPLFIPLLGWIIFHQKINNATWIGLSICFIGVLCILQPESSLFTLGSLIGLLAGLCQAISQTLFGAQTKEDHPLLNICYLFFFCMIGALTPYLCLESHWIPAKDFVLADIGLLVLLGITSICNQLFRASAYRQSTPSKLAAFLYFSVLFSGLIDWFVLKKSLNFLSVLGAFFIIGGGSLKTFFLFKKIK
ncbi:MAG: DMT family transporter [Chlamydiota bacterium]